MTAATGFKRMGIATAAAVLAVLAVLGTLALLIPADRVREAVKAEIRGVTGLDVSLRGDAKVTLFPHGTISFDNEAEIADTLGISAGTVKSTASRAVQALETALSRA